MSNQFKCDYCGKFISYTDFDNGLAVQNLLTPDSIYTDETWEVYHLACKDADNLEEPSLSDRS